MKEAEWKECKLRQNQATQ